MSPGRDSAPGECGIRDRRAGAALMAQGRLHPGVAPTTKGQVPDNNAVGNCLNFPWSDLVELRGIEPRTSAVRLQRSPI